MPIEFLFEIAVKPLPVVVHEQTKIDLLRVLVAAELVIANLPSSHSPEETAEILEITPLGRAYIRHGQQGKS
jgi:hypothetical protein